MRICDLQRKVSPDELLRLLDSAVRDYRSDILFVDSLMMCVRDDMDKKETDYVMTKLVEFARINNVHKETELGKGLSNFGGTTPV